LGEEIITLCSEAFFVGGGLVLQEAVVGWVDAACSRIS
jgi:hypothetical protein